METSIVAGVSAVLANGVHRINLEKRKVEELIEVAEELIDEAEEQGHCFKQRRKLERLVEKAKKEIDKKENVKWQGVLGGVGITLGIVGLSVALPVLIPLEIMAGLGIGGGFTWLYGKAKDILTKRQKELRDAIESLKDCLENS